MGFITFWKKEDLLLLHESSQIQKFNAIPRLLFQILYKLDIPEENYANIYLKVSLYLKNSEK